MKELEENFIKMRKNCSQEDWSKAVKKSVSKGILEQQQQQQKFDQIWLISLKLNNLSAYPAELMF